MSTDRPFARERSPDFRRVQHGALTAENSRLVVVNSQNRSGRKRATRNCDAKTVAIIAAKSHNHRSASVPKQKVDMTGGFEMSFLAAISVKSGQ